MPSPWLARLGYAPLLPIAVAVTMGIVADRVFAVPVLFSFLGALLALGAIVFAEVQQRDRLWVYQACGFAGLAACHHHLYRDRFPADHIDQLTSEEPMLVQVRGVLDEEPVVPRQLKEHPLVSIPRGERTYSILKLTELRTRREWVPVSGKVRLSVDGRVEGIHLGDEVELLGWLSRPGPPQNPGEVDFRQRLHDQRIRAELFVRHSPENLIRLELGWRNSLFGWLAQIRTRGQKLLAEQLPEEESRLAMALLLGETGALTSDEWQKYVRTGVIHVLAISGQHLVILGIFLSGALRLFGFRSRRIAWMVGLSLFAYALLTGARPSAIRAAVMVGVVCLGVLMRERIFPANAFSLAWIVILAINPTELFHPGFQLSFLAVGVLVWGLPNWFPPRVLTAAEELIEEFRPVSSQIVRWFGRVIFEWYRLTLVLALATAPLVIYWQNLLSPVGLLIGPPMVLLTSIALISGFGLLLSEAMGGLLNLPLKFVTEWSLNACRHLVEWADSLSLGSIYVGPIPEWWLVGFYSLGLVWLLWATLKNRSTHPKLLIFGYEPRASTFQIAILSWCCLGFVQSSVKPPLDEVRITFLSVGHGGCTVIETPDGRTLLYDIGALTGPELTRYHVGPFLWHRGIQRIDELFLSHADLDHFNGLPALLERFPIGQVSLTPSFRDKPTPGVLLTLNQLASRKIPLRVLQAGDQLRAGELTIDVLHPPPNGPEGAENARSLVLLLQHGEHRILLTGDLEKEGLAMLLARPRIEVDVLMAPHHGSKISNTDELRLWANPQLVISSEGKPRGTKPENPYQKERIPYWTTHEHGAITLHSHRSGLVAETFLTHQRMAIRSRK